jgi:peptidoglycan/LPS O-acetylase OafA/YrhL
MAGGRQINIQRAQNPETISALTGLRFIAALSVAVAHGVGFMKGDPHWHRWLTYSSAFGMSTFFVLSGFVIHYNYCDTVAGQGWRGIANFFSARFARLYPFYFVCFILTLYDHASYYSTPGTNPDFGNNFWNLFPYYLTMTQSWRYSIIESNSLIYGYPYSVVIADLWSISTEVFFYLTYPLVCFALIRLRRWWQTIGVAGAVAACALAGLWLAHVNIVQIDNLAVEQFGPIAGVNHGFQDSFFRWLIYFAPYSRFPEFLLGCLTAVLYRQLQFREPAAAERRIGQLIPYAAIGAIIAMVLIIASSRNRFLFLHFLHMNFGMALPVAALIFCTAHYRGMVSRALSANWMVLGGDASYSIYLLHPLIICQAGLNVLPVGESALLTSIVLIRLALALVVTVGFSLVTYRLIEVPARRLLRRLLTVDTGVPKVAPMGVVPEQR